MDSCCRICSRSDEFRRFPLFAVAEVTSEVIANMITSCTDTQVSNEDGLPQQICPDCLITLSLAYSFRKLCRRSEAKFRGTYEERQNLASSDQHQTQQQQQHSESQLQEDNTFESIPIKEEVLFDDYECDVAPQEEQWIIQNPRTIRDGAMTVVHNPNQYYEEEAIDTSGYEAASLVSIPEAYEMGESSTSGQKWKKQMPTPERFSKRIRLQESASHQHASQLSVPPASRAVVEPTITTISPSIAVLLPSEQPTTVIDSPVGPVSNPVQKRCEYCNKKVRKAYMHRNGKCKIAKNKVSKPRCVYCNMTFLRMTSLPGHLRNSCRVYREICEARSIERLDLDDSVQSSAASTGGAADDVKSYSKITASEKVQTETKPSVHQRVVITSKMPATCEHCHITFSKRGNLVKHMRQNCKMLKSSGNLRKVKIAADSTTQDDDSPGDDESLKSYRQKRLLNNQSAILKTANPVAHKAATAEEDSKCVYCAQPVSEKTQQQHRNGRCLLEQPSADEQQTKCVYCTQHFSEKTRYQHHNGRCVLGRPNTDNACPKCQLTFSSRSNMLKHQRERCQFNRKERKPPESKSAERTRNNPTPKEMVSQRPAVKESAKRIVVLKETDSLKNEVKRTFCKHCKQRIKESDRLKHKEKRCISVASMGSQAQDYSCGYCRKGFAKRESLIEHQRACTVRKLHKQVKCKHCGITISNRGNLRKHQQLYCKKLKREDDSKVEAKETKDVPSKIPKSSKKFSKLKQKDQGSRMPTKTSKLHKVKTVKSDDESPPVVKKEQPVAKLKIETDVKPVVPEIKEKKRSVKFHYPCQSCRRIFKTASLMQKHLLKCSVKLSTTEFKCQYCPEHFVKKSALYWHQRIACTGLTESQRAEIVNETIVNCLPADNSADLSSSFESPDKKANVKVVTFGIQPPLESVLRPSSVGQHPEDQNVSLLESDPSATYIVPDEEHLHREEKLPVDDSRLSENNNADFEKEPAPEPVEDRLPTPTTPLPLEIVYEEPPIEREATRKPEDESPVNRETTSTAEVEPPIDRVATPPKLANEPPIERVAPASLPEDDSPIERVATPAQLEEEQPIERLATPPRSEEEQPPVERVSTPPVSEEEPSTEQLASPPESEQEPQIERVATPPKSEEEEPPIERVASPKAEEEATPNQPEEHPQEESAVPCPPASGTE